MALSFSALWTLNVDLIPADLGAAVAILTDAFDHQDIAARWQRTKQHWNDFLRLLFGNGRRAEHVSLRIAQFGAIARERLLRRNRDVKHGLFAGEHMLHGAARRFEL